jgi:hypothetical protein
MSVYKIVDWIPKDKIKITPYNARIKIGKTLTGLNNNPNSYLLNSLDKLCSSYSKPTRISTNLYLLNMPISQNDDISWKALGLNKYVNNFLLLEYSKVKVRKILALDTPVAILRKFINWQELSASQDVLAIRILRENMHKIDWHILSGNPAAIEILKENLDLISWDVLSTNPAGIEILRNNLGRINYTYFPSNTSEEGISILGNNLEKIDEYGWKFLSCNKNAIEILKKNMDKVDWHCLSINDNAIELLEKYPHKIYWPYLSENINAIHILEKNLDKINWRHLSLNENAIHILEKNLDKINWSHLSHNKNALHLIEKMYKYDVGINWRAVMANPNIIVIDYLFLHKRMNIIREDLMMIVFHPKRVERYYKSGYDILVDEYV